MNTLGAIFALIGMFHCYNLLYRLIEAIIKHFEGEDRE